MSVDCTFDFPHVATWCRSCWDDERDARKTTALERISSDLINVYALDNVAAPPRPPGPRPVPPTKPLPDPSPSQPGINYTWQR